MNLEYSHRKVGEKVNTYWFKLEKDEETTLFFYTYSDFSGFKLNHDISNPRDFILIGAEILANMDYIRNKVNEQQKIDRKARRRIEK